MKLLLNPLTDQSTRDFLSAPSHCLIINGPIGSGKYVLACNIAAQILGINEAKLAAYPYFKRVAAEDESISIDVIRQLQQYLSLKTLSDKPISRAVIIENASDMTREAQNAALKTLEEPPQDTIIILTAPQPEKLLSTVRSRAVTITVRPISQDQALKYFVGLGHEESDIIKAYWLSEGCAGLLSALIENSERHPLALMINNVKDILTAEPYQRLIQAQELIADKKDLSMVLVALQKIASAGLKAASQKENKAAMLRWSKLLAKVLKTQDAVEANPSTKLLLTDLMLHV